MENPKKSRSASDRPLTARAALAADRSIRDIAQLEKRNYDARSHLDQISGSITNLAGSGPSILIHFLWFAVWLAINLHAIPQIPAFDPFPFSFLTMVVSLEAIFLTLFVLISQNRMAQEADKRDHLDLEINILAEREATMILRMLHEISGHLNIKGSARSELEELLKETRIEEVAQKLEDALPSA